MTNLLVNEKHTELVELLKQSSCEFTIGRRRVVWRDVRENWKVRVSVTAEIGDVSISCGHSTELDSWTDSDGEQHGEFRTFTVSNSSEQGMIRFASAIADMVCEPMVPAVVSLLISVQQAKQENSK